MAVSILARAGVDDENISSRNHDNVPAVRIRPGVVTALILFHASLILAPWTFTWAGFFTACALVLLTGPIGIGLGYHRLLCHRSFATASWLRYLFALLGVLACQRGPLAWSALHRLHHRDADSDHDPHMSGRGFLWAHILWAVSDQVAGLVTKERIRKLTADLHREPVLRFLERNFFALNALFALGLFLLGWLLDGFQLAASLVVWGFFVRIIYTWHVTLLVNSVSHRWGYRNYASPDNSRNCWWVALLTFGEGWHNNHHHRPRCAAHGHRWFELDLTYRAIRLLEWTGLAHGVVRPGKRLVFNRLESAGEMINGVRLAVRARWRCVPEMILRLKHEFR